MEGSAAVSAAIKVFGLVALAAALAAGVPLATPAAAQSVAFGQSADTDTVLASVKAYVGALNRLRVRRQKTAPDNDVRSVTMYS